MWTVAGATWEGVPEVLGTQTIDLTQGKVSTSISLQTYNAKIQLTDNSNNPVVGATVTVSFGNLTSKTFTSDSQGFVNLGRTPPGVYTAHILYQNQDFGSYQVDPSLNPVDTVKLGIGGGTSAPVVSGVVLLTIFGLALFLIVLAIRVRKPPPPPMIG